MTSTIEDVEPPAEAGDSRWDASLLPPRYEFLREIGRGSQKRIDLARDHLVGRNVIIARIDKTAMSEAEVETFRALHLDAERLEHPHIVPVEEIFEGRNAYLAVSPYLSGDSLEALLDSTPGRRLPTAQVLEIGRSVCDALAHAHERGVTHGDVKPANILLDSEGRAFLADFGLARIGSSSSSSKLRGTPAYLAPEVIRGDAPTPASDLYALGCTLYEALVGAPPFRGETMADLLRLQQVGRANYPRSGALRLPLQFILLIEKLLDKDPDARPGEAGDVQGALWGIRIAITAHAKSTPNADDAPDLVARRSELERIDEIIERVRRGSPQLTFVSGHGGIGKTRLIREAIESALQRDFLVLYGVATDDWPLLYGPFVRALVQLAGHMSALDGDVIDPIRDFLYLTVEGEPRTAGSSPWLPKDRLYSVIVSGLKKIARVHPVMIVLEDLQHADSATLDLLRYFDRAFADQPASEPFALSILATFRKWSAGAALVDLATATAREVHGTHLYLAPFAEPGSHAMLRALGVEQPSRSLIEQAHRYSEGNPLYLRDFVRQLRSANALETRDGRTDTRLPITELALPASMADWIAQRIDGLSPDAAMLLPSLAIVGFEFDRQAFETLATARGFDAANVIREGIDASLIKSSHDSIEFFHPLVREALVKRLDANETRRIHSQAAEIWLGARDRNPRRRELEIVRHLIGAGSFADPMLVARYAGRAARHAMDRFAWREATAFLAAAIEHANDPIERARLHLQAAHAHFHLLDADLCLEHYEHATRALGSGLAPRLSVRILIDHLRAIVWLGDFRVGKGAGKADDLRKRMDTREADDPRLRAEALTALSEFEFFRGDPKRAGQLARTALALTDPDRDAWLQSEISMTLGFVEFNGLRVRDALTTWQRGVEQGRSSNHVLGVSVCAQTIQIAYFRTGDFEGLSRAEALTTELKRSLRIPGEFAISSGVRATTALARGELAESERAARETIELVRHAKHPWAIVLGAAVLASVRALHGDLAGARSSMDQLEEFEVDFADFAKGQMGALPAMGRQLCRAVVGEPVRVPAAERGELIDRLDRGVLDERTLYTVGFATEMAAATQDVELATASLRYLERIEELGWVFATAWSFFVPRLRGVAATLAGDFELAERSFENAMSWTRRLALPIEEGRTALDLAQMLALRNAEGDRARARELAARARRAFEICPKSAFAARAEKLQAYLVAEVA